MQIRVGYEIVYQCPRETPMILMVHIHYSRAEDIVIPDHLKTNPIIPVISYRDLFGNWCARIVAPAGRLQTLRRRGDITVGDNQPYDLDPAVDYSIPFHAMRRHLAYLQIEFRQDEIADAKGQAAWAQRLAAALPSVLPISLQS